MDDRSAGHRRAASRTPMQAMITYRLDGQEYGNLAADVSPDGIFIRTFMPPPVGTRLELTAELPEELGGFAVELEGVVRRRVDGEDPRHNGMGIQFTAVHASEPAAVRFLAAQVFGITPAAAGPAAAEPASEPEPPMDDGDTIPQ